MRRRRRARGHPVLQPALPGRHLRALPDGGRGGGRPARHALRHPGPHRPAHRHDDHAPPGPRGAGHRGAQGRGRRPADDGAPGRAGPRGLRDLQRRRRHDPAPDGGRRGRHHQRGRALDRRRSSARSSTPSWPATSPPPSPATPSCSTPSTSSPPRSSPTRCRPRPCCGPWACGSASAACRWARPPPSSTPRPRRSWPPSGHPRSRSPRLPERSERGSRGNAQQAEAEAGPGRLPGRARRDRPELRLHRGRRADPHPRLRDHVPRSGHAGHRPGPARVHLPPRPQGPGRRHRAHPRPRGPHRRPGLPAARGPRAHLRLRADRRPGPPPHRRGRPGGPHQVHLGGGRRDGEDRRPATSSSSRSRTRCPRRWPSRSTPRRA